MERGDRHDSSDASADEIPERADFRSEILARLARRHGQDRYQMKGEIGRGGQGAILQVWDEDLRRNLAMKVIHARTDAKTSNEESSRALGRFLEEAQITGQLSHPGIVPVHELGLDAEGRVYFTMRLVKGRDLKEILDLLEEGKEGWNLPRALSVLLKVCEALAYAHQKGVIHRDLKPRNVRVGRFGEVYVMDWGLARVLGHADSHDLRLAEHEKLSQVESERAQAGSDELVTLDGTVIGTPAYMSPEQARGEIADLDARADVYSAGAMLYHVLTGQPPYVPRGTNFSSRAILWRVVEGPPRPVHELNPRPPAELLAICEKAMARDPARRYRDMSELAQDLSAFLEHRVVRAYQTGALAELRKWIRRNRPLAGALAFGVVALAVGTAVAWLLKTESDHNAVQAREQGELAQRSQQDVMRLSALQDLDDLEHEADLLWPPDPSLLERYERWLRDAEALIAGLDPSPDGRYQGHRAKLAELEGRALGASASEAAPLSRSDADRLDHHLHGLRILEADLASLETPPVAAVLAPEALPQDVAGLVEQAWIYVHPARVVLGQEARGLALAELARERAQDDLEFAQASDVLSWALLAVGRHEEAIEAGQAALEVETGALEAELLLSQQALRLRIASLQPAQVEAARERIQLDIDRLRPDENALAFADDADRWWHAQLERLVQRLQSLSDEESGLVAGVSREHGWGIERRRAFAETIEERSRSGPEAARAWSEAVRSIRDPVECPQYSGLALTPQLGLLPLGRDPDSGLWEFAHLLSGEPAVRGADGRLILGEQTGIVLVLLPGGHFYQGAQSQSPELPNYDPEAVRVSEGGVSPMHAVRLSPFFLSKYELTQGQWLRFSGENPSRDTPLAYSLYWNRARRPGSLLHPVEQVSWDECRLLLGRMGLELPSEAQWEYAARGGTGTPWWTGGTKESLAGAANLLDAYANRNGNAATASPELWLDDGHTVHAPVGSFRANPFGLHDVIGNVWEWCLDKPGNYAGVETMPLDPVLAPWETELRETRGGSHESPAFQASSAMRTPFSPNAKVPVIGLRPCRRVEFAGR